jgi:hypothetical protein
MKIIIEDGMDTWELNPDENTELGKEVVLHANALVEIAKKIISQSKDVKTEIKIK